MRDDHLAHRLREEMSGVRVSPALRRRTLDAMRGKEEPIMRKKGLTALAVALIGVLLCGVALAAGRAGMFDFIGRRDGISIPEDAESFVQRMEETAVVDGVTTTVREMYYDGRTLRLTVDFTPPDGRTLLTAAMNTPDDPWQNLASLTAWDESDKRTIADVCRERGYVRGFDVNLACEDEEEGRPGAASQDAVLGEDGTLTLFVEQTFPNDKPERTLQMTAVTRGFAVETDGSWTYEDETTRTPFTLTATAAARSGEGEAAQAYVSDAPTRFEQVGVTVERVSVEVKPLELYVTIEGTIDDEALYAETTEDGLWFEIIDPAIETDEPYKQRLAEGLTASGEVDGSVDEDGTRRFTQTQTLSAGELRDAYTLRAFSVWDKTRFDAHEIAMRPATPEEIEALRSAQAETPAAPEDTPQPEKGK